MIIKNHTIELEDTSPAEMARFRQIMIGIWRQQIEDDKNAGEWEKLLKDHYATAKELDTKYANNSKKPDEITLKGDRYILNNEDHYQYTNAIALKEVVVTASISPLVSILLWIKKNIGNKTQKLQLDSFPKNAPLNFNGIIKGYKISCNRQLLEAIVDLKNIEFKVSFLGKTFFLLDIFDLKKNLALRFETDSYEGMEFLAEFIGYDLKKFKEVITQYYRTAIAAAGNDKDKLDVIYEVIPDFILASLKTDQQMYADIWTLLDQNVSDIGGRDEDQGILNILKTLQKKDAKKLFTKLYERPLWVMRLYETFSGEHRRAFVALIMDLCRYNKKAPEAKQQIYLPNGYWPSNLQLTANWSQNKIKFENTTTILNNLGNNLAYPTSGLFPSAVNEHKKTYEGAPLNPMDFITVKSIIEIDNDKKSTTEATSNQVALFIKYKVDELSQEAFWDVINVATTLAGGYGAIEVLTTQATGRLLKTLAVIELTKTIADLVMLTDRAKKALKEAGLGVLVDNWTTISISADLSFLSLGLLISLAKYGRKGAKVLNELNETEHATHREKQTEKAFTEIEKQTGVDVSKMSEKEFEKFYKKIEKKEKGNPEQYGEFIDTPENIPRKIAPKENINLKRESRRKEISEETEKGYWRDKDHNDKVIFSSDQLETFVEIELIHETKVRPSRTGEAGDVVGLSGKWTGKTFDAAGLPNNPGAIKGWEYKFITNLNKFKKSIDVHFNKLKGTPPLDKFVLDLRYIDKYPPKTKKEIMNYLEENYELYLNNKDKFEIIF